MNKITPKSEIDFSSFYDQLYKECLAMAQYALASGKMIPPGTSEIIQIYAAKTSPQNIRRLLQIHAQLGRIIAPAKPRTILLMEEDSLKKSTVRLFGPFPLIRRLIMVAFIFLCLFISILAFPQVDFSLSIIDQSGSIYILLILGLIVAAGLGASFGALFQVKKYTVNGTYENKYEVSYWIRFVLGIAAGFILSLLIDIPIERVGSVTGNYINNFEKPLLAVLGGFSANLVYRFFNRLIESVESLITGDRDETFSAKEQEMKSQMMVMEEDFRIRQEAASGLINVLKDIDPQTDPQIKGKLTTLLKKFTPMEHTDYEDEVGIDDQLKDSPN